MNAIESSWLAGLFDGEGCIVIVKTGKSTYTLCARIHMCSLPAIERTNELFEGRISGTREDKVNHNWRPSWTWEVKGDNAEQFLKIIYPYSICKKDEIDIALKFQAERGKFHGKEVPIEIIEKRQFYKEELARLKRICYTERSLKPKSFQSNLF